MNSRFCKLDCVLPFILRFRFTLLRLRSQSAFSSSAFRTAIWSAIWLESLCSTRCSRASKALNTCELVVILDGGRRGNAAGLVNPWVGASKDVVKKEASAEAEEGDDGDEDKARDTAGSISKRSMYVVMSESSLRARRALVRGTASLQLRALGS